MYRKVIEKIIDWKNSPDRKPLVLKGARQVGKTWIMKEMGKQYYNDYVYFNFDKEIELKSIFEKNKDPERLIELLSLLSGKKILANETLIILDEIQECPAALNSLKYFNEEASDYHIVTAGSLLGTLLSKPQSYPVGQVNIITIYPFTFDEFLLELDNSLYQYYLRINKNIKIETIFHKKLIEAYNYYLIIGGMPEVISSWIKYKDPKKIISIQKDLISIYENDFAKYNGKVNSGRILLVFRNIVSQLGKENKKFIYGCLKEGARAREFEEAIEWLVSSNLVVKVYNVTKSEHPLNAFEVFNNFKLYFFDTGLLKIMAGVENGAILLKSDFQFKGALAENFILQQITPLELQPHFYAENELEIDFIIQKNINIIPIEVKSGTNVESNSIKKYTKLLNPITSIVFSKLEYTKNENFLYIPLYLANKLKELI